MTLHIPATWRVFVLDDQVDRLRWFRERIPNMTAAKTSAEAIEILALEKFDLVFLDHDLTWEDAADVTRQHGNGKEVARYLRISAFAGRVVIHSKNDAAVELMRRILPAARRERFGDFDIALTERQSCEQ